MDTEKILPPSETHTSSLDAEPVVALPDEGKESQPMQLTDTPNPGPQVFRDLYSLCESFEPENGELRFLYTAFSFIDDEGIAYFGKELVRKKLIDIQGFRQGLKRVADDEVYPKVASHITAVSIPVNGDVYVKRPKLGPYAQLQGTGMLPRLFLREAETLEFLMKHPHPNIVRYHGSVFKRNHITGLVLDRFPLTLDRQMEDPPQGFDNESCINGVASALKHLHSLGLAHNDLNPYNVMLDEHNTPILIDFDSCQPFGTALLTGGTPGWTDGEITTSEQRNDEFALGKLRTWLEEKTKVS